MCSSLLRLAPESRDLSKAKKGINVMSWMNKFSFCEFGQLCKQFFSLSAREKSLDLTPNSKKLEDM